MKKATALFSMLALILVFSSKTYAHCEVPCGIYHDEVRIALIKEHIQTIEKAINQINDIQNAETVNYNQLVRWINTKEEHANKIQEIVKQYFMTQRVKVTDKSDEKAFNKYIKQLTSLHELLVYSMKTKQSLDIENIQKLRNSLEKFEVVYFEGKHRHKITDEHKH